MKEVLTYILQSERITNVKLAAILDVAPASISHILSGRNKPSYDFLVKLVEAFPRYDARWIVTGKGDPIKGQLSALEEVQERELSPQLFDFDSDSEQKFSDSNQDPISLIVDGVPASADASPTTAQPGIKTRLIVCFPDRTFIEYEQK